MAEVTAWILSSAKDKGGFGGGGSVTWGCQTVNNLSPCLWHWLRVSRDKAIPLLPGTEREASLQIEFSHRNVNIFQHRDKQIPLLRACFSSVVLKLTSLKILISAAWRWLSAVSPLGRLSHLKKIALPKVISTLKGSPYPMSPSQLIQGRDIKVQPPCPNSKVSSQLQSSPRDLLRSSVESHHISTSLPAQLCFLSLPSTGIHLQSAS